MQISAEVRWFFQGGPPAVIEAWFRDGNVAPGGGRVREDVYLLDPKQAELGLKKRGKKPGVEVKGLVAVLPPIAHAPFTAPIELWTKWTTEALSIDAMPVVAVAKKRWLRKYDAGGPTVRELVLDVDEKLVDAAASLPALGCNLELTLLDLPGAPGAWSSLSFEAFGPLREVDGALRRTAFELAMHAPPSMPGALQLGYPAWLCYIHAAVARDATSSTRSTK